MGAQPGDCLDDGAFELSEHTEAHLSLAESAEKIAEHFSAISQLYSPLDVFSLPNYVQDTMNDLTHQMELPQLTEYEVWKKIEHAKKPKGGVPGDLPRNFPLN